MIFQTAASDLRRRLQRWADARRPPSSAQQLNHHSLFIFPSGAGLVFLALVTMLWLVGTNYENNLVLALAFLLISLFVVTILHTFTNLAGVSIQLLGTGPAFSGEAAEVRLLISRPGKRGRDNILLRWGDSQVQVLSLVEEAEKTVSLFVPTASRGWFDPGRLRIESRYPLGILRCWARLDMDCRILVYPRPIPAGPLPLAQAVGDEGELSSARGADEFAGYREYQAGDSLRNVAWKQYARGMGLYSRDYSAFVDSRLWLDWDYLGGLDREARLSRLCYWVQQASRTESEYGLRLPGQALEPGKGPAHLERALRMLALFENSGNAPHRFAGEARS
jgi:uncharacterized protein (DUF58 family)